MISLATACLALTVYFESRGEPTIGQQYVAHVTMNRSEGYEHNGVCSAVFAKNQFTWTGNIKSSKQPIVMVKRAIKQIDEPESWKKSVEIAKEVIDRKSDITNGARYFNEKKLGRKYRTDVKAVKIGKHLFY